ncbi:tetratricopeptide repeat protein [Verrucomicrobiota bacterium]
MTVAPKCGNVIRLAFGAACASAVFAAAPAPGGRDQAPAGEAISPLVVARAALEDNLYSLAESHLRRFLGGTPSPVDSPAYESAVDMLFRSLHEQDKHGEIRDFIRDNRDSLGKTADRGISAFWEAMSLYRLGREDEALVLLEGFDERYAGTRYAARAARLKAWCLAQAGLDGQAVEVFGRFEAEHGDSPEIARNRLDWAEALLGEGRSDEAVEVLRTLLSLPAHLEEAQEGRCLLGRVLAERGEWTNAAVHLVSVIDNERAHPDLRSEAWFSLARLYQAQENVEQAVTAWEKGVEGALSPDLKRRGRLSLGLALMDLDRTEEGAPLLKDFVVSAPTDPAAGTVQLRLAEALLEQGGEKAAEEFQYYLETFTNVAGRARAQRGKGWALLALGRNAEAAAAFIKAGELSTNAADRGQCLLKAGDAHFANGQYKLAAEQYAGLVAEFPRGEHAPAAYVQLGESLARSGQIEAAEGRLREFVDAFPDHDLRGEAMLRIGRLQDSQGKLAEAVETFNRLMGVSSNGALFGEALLGRGMAWCRMTRFEGALGDFERTVALFPEGRLAEQAYHMTSVCQYWLGRDVDALATAEDFLARFPESDLVPDVLFWLGKQEYNRANYEQAEERFAELVEEYGTDANAERALLWAGRSAAMRDEYLLAIERFTQFLKQYPDSEQAVEALYAQGEALFHLAKTSDAILVFDEIVNRHPGSEMVWRTWLRIGDCQFWLGVEDPKRYEEAIESYRIVSETDDPNTRPDLLLEAAYKTGKCLQKLGRTEDAIDVYYSDVMVRFLDERERGEKHGEASKTWFRRASRDMADIMSDREEWRKVVNILERVIEAGVSVDPETKERIRKIRSEHWWLFY